VIIDTEEEGIILAKEDMYTVVVIKIGKSLYTSRTDWVGTWN